MPVGVRLTNDDLVNVVGGIGPITGALLNGLSRFFQTIHNVGRSLGSAIRRLSSGNVCY